MQHVCFVKPDNAARASRHVRKPSGMVTESRYRGNKNPSSMIGPERSLFLKALAERLFIVIGDAARSLADTPCEEVVFNLQRSLCYLLRGPLH